MVNELINLLVNATKMGFVEWTPIEGGEFENSKGRKVSCYKTIFNGFTVQTVVKRFQKKRLFGGEDSFLVEGLIVEKGEQKIVISSDPDLMPGVSCDDDSVFLRVFVDTVLPRLVKSKDIVQDLTGQLSKMLYYTPRKSN